MATSTGSLGGNQVAGQNPTTPLNAPQGQQPLNQGQGVGMQTNQMENSQAGQGAPGVNPSPITPPGQPGWTYGANPTQNQIQGQVAPGQADTSRVGWNGAPTISVGGAQGYFQPAVDAYQQQAMSRLNPQLQEQQANLENQLQQQGLTRGSSAWNAEMDRQMRSRNDATMGVTNQALMMGGQEAARMQGMDINAGNFANTAAQQNFTNNLSSQSAQNAAYGQQFNQNLQAGQFTNQAQAQEFGQNATQANIRNQSMGAQAQLAETTAARQQQASQFSQSYDLQNRTQQAQMDQFAQTMGMTGRQLDAQIGQWAAQNGISREQMANQLLMSREQNATATTNAGISANASMAATSAQGRAASAANDLANRQFEYNMQRQGRYDDPTITGLWQNLGGAPTANPAMPAVPQQQAPGAQNPNGAVQTQTAQNQQRGINYGQMAGSLAGYFLGG